MKVHNAEQMGTSCFETRLQLCCEVADEAQSSCVLACNWRETVRFTAVKHYKCFFVSLQRSRVPCLPLTSVTLQWAMKHGTREINKPSKWSEGSEMHLYRKVLFLYRPTNFKSRDSDWAWASRKYNLLKTSLARVIKLSARKAEAVCGTHHKSVTILNATCIF